MNRHPFDPISLVAGVLFAGLGIAFFTGNVQYSQMDLKFVWPLVILALGLALLMGARGPERPHDAVEDGGSEDEPAAPERQDT